MIDIGIFTGSGIYELPLAEGETRVVDSHFGEAEVSVLSYGPWTVGNIARHGKGHLHLPHTIPHQANLVALKQLGARAVFATTATGAVDPGGPSSSTTCSSPKIASPTAKHVPSSPSQEIPSGDTL